MEGRPAPLQKIWTLATMTSEGTMKLTQVAAFQHRPWVVQIVWPRMLQACNRGDVWTASLATSLCRG